MNYPCQFGTARTQAHISDLRMRANPASLELENHFSKVYGPNIEYNYVEKLNACMHDIDFYFRTSDHSQIKKIYCSLIYLEIRFRAMDINRRVPYMEIIDVKVRPCIQGMGVFRAFMWKLFTICRQNVLDMRIAPTTDHLYAILRTISPDFNLMPQCECKLMIRHEDINNISLDSLGIRQIFFEQGKGNWILNPSMFPNAEVFNANFGKNMAASNHRMFLQSLNSIASRDSDMDDLSSSMQTMTRKRGHKDNEDGHASSWTSSGRKTRSLR